MDAFCTKKEEREFNNAMTLYHRAAKFVNPNAAKRAAEIFEKLGQMKWAEAARELCYELKARAA